LRVELKGNPMIDVNEIKIRRIEKRIKLKELSGLTGKSISQISAWLNGKRTIPIESIKIIVDYLDGEIIEARINWKN
jgi:transcriptional regulator with XRE-family HTH domain